LLVVAGLQAGWLRAPVVDGLDLSVAPGEIVGILGGNGSGKSTLLAAVSGLLRPRGGCVSLAGRDLTGLPPERIAVAGLRLLPQTRRVFGSLTVAENLMAPELATGRPDIAALRAGVESWLTRFPELERRRHEKASSLSGGQQQLVAIGRVLSTGPSALLLDEPSAGLSAAAELQVAQVLTELSATGVAIVLVEQDVRFARTLTDRVLHLRGGRLSET
jgi:branched-chain amino acid transport system ATP-binding protein